MTEVLSLLSRYSLLLSALAACSDARPPPSGSNETENPSNDRETPPTGGSPTTDGGELSAEGGGLTTAADGGVVTPIAATDARSFIPAPFTDVSVTRAVEQPKPPPVCDVTSTWGEGRAAFGTGHISAHLLDVTPNGQHWLYLSADGDPPNLVLADATNTRTLTVPETYDAAQGAALSADGKMLVVTRADARGFGSIIRENSNDPFGDSFAEAEFSELNELAVQYGTSVSQPHLGALGDTLYYSTRLPIFEFFQARLVGGWWSFEKVLNPDYLRANGHELSLSSLSSDQLTIFYWDANAEQTLALWRSRVDLPFMDPTSIKTASDAIVHDAHPAENCKALFYRSVGGELLVAEAR